MKKKFPGVLKQGMKLFSAMVAVVAIIGAYNYFFGARKISDNFIIPDVVMCKGLKKPVLSKNSDSVKQIVRSDCFSTVIVSPSTPKAKIAWNAPGAVDVCFWKLNRCAAWMHINDGQIQEKSRKDIPSDYTAILLRGDPGEADIHLLR